MGAADRSGTTREVYVSRLQAEHLYKVFGRRSDEAVRRLESGATRDELRADGATAAVIDASFTVDPGQIFVVMGLSGSGKSTLLRMLNGLLEPTAGRVLFDGRDLTALNRRELRSVRSRRISMVFQHFALFPHRSVAENAAYGLEVQGVDRAEREERAREALALAGLAGWEDSWPDELSGGMQQRVGLARALATDADLLLMDESFSALDPLIRRDMQDQLLELQKTLKKTIVFITHDLNEAMRLGDRIAVMRDGRVVQQGTAEDILITPADDYVASFTQDVDRTRVLTAGAIMADPESAYGTRTDEGTELRSAAEVLGAAPAVVRADTPITELFTPCSRSGVAVAVTCERGELIGVVPRARLLAVLGEPMKPEPDGPPAADGAADGAGTTAAGAVTHA
ncbi:betaine/proline/choline family ABC transporter ATP-binding protein [Streptomyces sp. SID5473]|uniref:Glycine/betaine ABC transporter ATP-binding protein n=1 Tax=Streptomyces tsukubensis (strain DSM 42081 / NBRC 108919 / NRRL 18488 / 9993) TaxID=1114943 RepID=I2MVL7_STRT9|nr:betaine/proline/choline family ABC transporter ATP-binding protein [Streptomyces sp. SID5473]AZK93275.1 glycine/betaine ABC transporter ATP-binding protein [Streptomyces tsukubensis]EIF88814.1 glycine betaine/L-proline ABC transporter ATP-binding protein [Streptomyces tsukubensis NRRL18488]MYS63054.1 betaine/proline/choline family ABC transporter ATP-binding protein [Streptomyces sp. SID5473]QKM70570.1 glycine/betaine ABC transporter ATP-binding protein [Streptomyces tsukubensis NRRL18488]T